MMYINNKKSFVMHCEDVMFLPGTNVVDDAKKEKSLKDSPKFKELCDGGVLEEVKTETSKGGAPKSINTMTASEAVKIVSGILDISELQALAGQDARKAVQDAIKKQIAKVKE